MEDLAWRSSRQGPAFPHSDVGDDRVDVSVRQEGHWAAAHTADLRRWDELDRTMDLRTDALARLAHVGIPERGVEGRRASPIAASHHGHRHRVNG